MHVKILGGTRRGKEQYAGGQIKWLIKYIYVYETKYLWLKIGGKIW
jgi:hypothetical protein